MHKKEGIQHIEVLLEWLNANSGFVTALLSLIAVIVAIAVPALIAASEKKIALFEERHKVYSEIDFIRGFCDSIKNLGTYKNLDDSDALRYHLFSVWVMCLRTKYPEAWRIRFEISPQKKYAHFLGVEKEMQMICEMRLQEQFANLGKSQYVFSKDIENKVRSIAEEYYNIVSDMMVLVFYGSESDSESFDLGQFLKKVENFENDKAKEKMWRALKL